MLARKATQAATSAPSPKRPAGIGAKDAFLLAVVQGVGHRADDEARCDAVHRDAAAGHFGASDFVIAVKPALAAA